MIAAAFPGFLIAGGVFAAIPVALHFLSRRPPSRAALPTARFLTEDPRTLLRLQRRPTDLRILLIRVAFALALASAFAGLRWMPERSGTARIVLVDAGADGGVTWEAVVAEARQAMDGSDQTATAGRSESASGSENTPDSENTSDSQNTPDSERASDSENAPSVFLAYGLDDGPRLVEAPALEELSRGTRPATAEDGLRALRDVAAGGRFARASVTWVGRPSWHAWSDGLGVMRAGLWPGRVVLRPVEASDPEPDATAAPPSPTRPVAWIPDGTDHEPLRQAAEALGHRVASAETARSDGGDDAPAWIVSDAVSPAALEPLVDRARAGATLVLSGPPPGVDTILPWLTGATGAGGPDGPSPSATADVSSPAIVLLPGQRAVGTPVTRLPGAPARDGRTLAIFDDGTPAAAARPLGAGCVVYLAVDLSAPELTTSAEYPTLVRTLAEGCIDPGPAEGPLDRGALLALERPDLPEAVDVATLFASEGVPLTRWLLLLALALLGAEVAMSRERTT